MPTYARYDPTITPISPVTGWFDTDTFPHLVLPATGTNCALLELTEEQWSTHDAAGFGVNAAGALVRYTKPPAALTLPQQARKALLAGLAITSTSTAALDGTYPVDADTQNHIQAEVTALLLSGNAAFADGTGELAWPDSTGTLHNFTPAQFTALARAVAAYVAALYKVINGSATTLPPATATIA